MASRRSDPDGSKGEDGNALTFRSEKESAHIDACAPSRALFLWAEARQDRVGSSRIIVRSRGKKGATMRMSRRGAVFAEVATVPMLALAGRAVVGCGGGTTQSTATTAPAQTTASSR
jgi:hypothetical protein